MRPRLLAGGSVALLLAVAPGCSSVDSARSVDAATPTDAAAPPDAEEAIDAVVDAPMPDAEPFVPTGPGYTVTPDLSDVRVARWEGWGGSLAWWANGVGGSAYESLYADLLFTRQSVSVLGQSLPGLGLGIVRYNVGGGGRPGDIPDTVENVPAGLPWFKDLDGFERDWNNHEDPTSASWDWSRDVNQRSVLEAARARGVVVELFANAPMWWMTDAKSSAGGRLQSWNRRDFARHLATVAAHARAVWGVEVGSVEAFNEPTAGWWNYPGGQEGCNVSVDEQREILGALREELDARGLGDVAIAASDENSMSAARQTYQALAGVAGLIGKVNVHGYNGLDPWRDNAVREALHADVGDKRLWMSEYGDPDGSGLTLAQTIVEDLNHLRPSAWIYWQPIEPYSGWGLVNAAYADAADQANRGAPTWVYTKYFVFAQFTRFIRAGQRLVGSSDQNTVVAYDPGGRQLVFVTLNYGNAQYVTYDLHGAGHGSVAHVTYTETNSAHVYASFDVPIVDGSFVIPEQANSVYSITVDGVE